MHANTSKNKFDQHHNIVVVLSGGMDSAICLAQVVAENSNKNDPQNGKSGLVYALSFSYQQRHSVELAAAQKIAQHFKVEHTIIDLSFFAHLTSNALIHHDEKIKSHSDSSSTGAGPNTLVAGRNGIFARIAALFALQKSASTIVLGVIGIEESNSGYRDCNRSYFDREEIQARMDINNPHFTIRTPLVDMTKLDTLELAHQLQCLEFLLEESVSCYEGIKHFGCGQCPACKLRNTAIGAFLKKHPLQFSYQHRF